MATVWMRLFTRQLLVSHVVAPASAQVSAMLLVSFSVAIQFPSYAFRKFQLLATAGAKPRDCPVIRFRFPTITRRFLLNGCQRYGICHRDLGCMSAGHSRLAMAVLAGDAPAAAHCGGALRRRTAAGTSPGTDSPEQTGSQPRKAGLKQSL
jgi:hypothetical protein